jgi:hypothetical protein
MFDDETMKVLAKVRWNATDLCRQLELKPEELDASNDLTEKILMLADDHFCRSKTSTPSLRTHYLVAAVAQAMAGVNLLAQMHEENGNLPNHPSLS